MAKILIVDDSALSRRMLRAMPGGTQNAWPIVFNAWDDFLISDILADE